VSTGSKTTSTVATLAEITTYLHEELPLTRAMGVEAAQWDGKSLMLRAPLELNVNHTDTAFGGSISSLGILAGYMLLYLATKERGISCRLLIQKSTTEFLRPIDTVITATAALPGDEALGDFVSMLVRKRKARLELETQVLSRKTLAAVQRGLYVAIVY